MIFLHFLCTYIHLPSLFIVLVFDALLLLLLLLLLLYW